EHAAIVDVAEERDVVAVAAEVDATAGSARAVAAVARAVDHVRLSFAAVGEQTLAGARAYLIQGTGAQVLGADLIVLHLQAAGHRALAEQWEEVPVFVRGEAGGARCLGAI